MKGPWDVILIESYKSSAEPACCKGFLWAVSWKEKIEKIFNINRLHIYNHHESYIWREAFIMEGNSKTPNSMTIL